MIEGLPELFALCVDVAAVSTSCKKRYESTDVRRAIAGTFGNTINSYRMNVSMIAQQQNMPTAHMKEFVELTKYNRHAIVVMVYSRLEHCLRELWARLEIKAYDSKSSFDGILRGLLKRLDLVDQLPLLEICRRIRNSVHNNAIYFGTDAAFVWKGVLFGFVNSEPISFFEPSIIHPLLSDMWAFAKAVLASPIVSSPAKIEMSVNMSANAESELLRTNGRSRHAFADQVTGMEG
jgi:hypothetical protein